MPISFECPQCGKKLKAPDEAVGKSSKCPGCEAIVTCPEPIYDAEVVDDSQPHAGLEPYAGLDDDKPYGLVNPTPFAAPSGESRRPCPMCREMILTTAAKCRYCGEVFDSTLKKADGTKSKSYGPDDEDLATVDMVLASLPMCTLIGCVAGIVYMIQGKPKGMKMFGLSFVMAIVWNIVRVMLESAFQQPAFPGGP